MTASPSTSPGRCRPAPPCSRRAPAPARPSPSPPWSPATSPSRACPLDQLLVITFGRAASQELRERVREQLVQAERALADPATADRDHPVVAHLLDADDAEVAPAPPAARRAGVVRRRDHRDHPPVLPDRAALARGRRRHRHRRHPGRVARRPRRRGGRRRLPPPLRQLDRRPAVRPRRRPDPGAHRGRRRPCRAGAVERQRSPRPERGSRSPSEVRDEVDRRKRRLGILSYDDLLGRLADALDRRRRAGPASGCGSGGRSCWSTSSRTPTPSSGRCSTGPSPATPRWC